MTRLLLVLLAGPALAQSLKAGESVHSMGSAAPASPLVSFGVNSGPIERCGFLASTTEGTSNQQTGGLTAPTGSSESAGSNVAMAMDAGTFLTRHRGPRWNTTLTADGWNMWQGPDHLGRGIGYPGYSVWLRWFSEVQSPQQTFWGLFADYTGVANCPSDGSITTNTTGQEAYLVLSCRGGDNLHLCSRQAQGVTPLLADGGVDWASFCQPVGDLAGMDGGYFPCTKTPDGGLSKYGTLFDAVFTAPPDFGTMTVTVTDVETRATTGAISIPSNMWTPDAGLWVSPQGAVCNRGLALSSSFGISRLCVYTDN